MVILKLKAKEGEKERERDNRGRQRTGWDIAGRYVEERKRGNKTGRSE